MKNLKSIILATIFFIPGHIFSMDRIEFFKRYFSNIDTNDNLTYELIKSIAIYTPQRGIDKFLFREDLQLKNIKSLISHGANINIQGENGSSLAHLVCERLDFETLKLLINLNINLNIEDNNEHNPLLYMLINSRKKLSDAHAKSIGYLEIKENYIKIIIFLIKSGADYRIKNDYEKSIPKLWVPFGTLKGRRHELLYLQVNLEKIIAIKENIISEICIAINNDNKTEAKKLLLKGYKYFYDLDQNNMLHVAALKNQLESFKLILMAAPELINEKNRYGKTPLELNPGILIRLMPQMKLEKKEEVTECTLI